MTNQKLDNLKNTASQLRRLIVDAVYNAKSGHIGGSLSSADILTALYFAEMNIDPNNPKWEERDRFVLSKGHITPAYYGVLALRGFFPVEELKNFRKFTSFLQGHPDKNKVPGVDMSSGSLGQGLSTAVGIALAGKLKKANYRTYALVGDGEMQEGQIWEALMFAAARNLDNLCVIVDDNGVQADGRVEDICPLQPLDKKMQAFNLNTIIVDGHDYKDILSALENAKTTKGKPTVIIAKTVKGKGVSFMENKSLWHGKAPNDSEYAVAMAELKGGAQ